ncbi:hypothetical protein PtA15_11A582 [Puccinia triticina]|uniref:Uncharacterized protein n=1 Tax=Puccinia triticina TaxID=208348 RepID=A0ABY7CY68_9BASI|nr:uncharacterized protein PtA15_11A582 [Puccinia triticina]WAQ89890.1 hypothetical protein PtA15_11A582 [Puccinia triticina]
MAPSPPPPPVQPSAAKGKCPCLGLLVAAGPEARNCTAGQVGRANSDAEAGRGASVAQPKRPQPRALGTRCQDPPNNSIARSHPRSEPVMPHRS